MGGQALHAHGWFLEPTPSAPQKWEHCQWWLTQIMNRVSPSFFFFGLVLLLVSQPVAMYHLTHSITSAFYMDNIYLEGTFLARKRNKTGGGPTTKKTKDILRFCRRHDLFCSFLFFNYKDISLVITDIYC